VQLDALLVRDESGFWADCKMRDAPPPPPGASHSNDVERLLAPPFLELAPDDAQQMRARGAHLHWALPDGLTRGTAEETSSGGTSFPAVPDRWLVVRLFPSAAQSGKRGVMAWLLEGGMQRAQPTELAHWIDPGPVVYSSGHPLTALGLGDPAWAAYYDNVLNRFGFYDDLAGVAHGPISYLVCGWYSHPEHDPLGSATLNSLQDFDAVMKTLGWELAPGELDEVYDTAQHQTQTAQSQGLPTYPTDENGLPEREPDSGAYWTSGDWWPQQILCHGSVVGLNWPGTGGAGITGEFGDPPSASDITVALGGTLAEALGIVVATADTTPEQAPLLEAFHLGLLRELDQPDGRARLDAALHSSRFASAPGGDVAETITQSVSVEASTRTGDANTMRADMTNVSLRDDLSGRDSGGAPGIASAGKSVFIDAGNQHEYSSASQAPFVPFVPFVPFSPGSGLVEEGNLGAVMSAIGVGITPEGSSGSAGVGTTFRQETIQVQRALPRFWSPQDPVILIQGGRRCFKHGSDGLFVQDGRLICRLSGYTVTHISARSPLDGSTYLTITGDELLEHGLEHGGIPLECEDLLRETALLDPGAASEAATIASASASGGAAGVNADALARLADNFAVEQTVWWSLRNPQTDITQMLHHSGISGTLPSPIAVTPSVHPWLPRHLDWEIEYLASPRHLEDWALGELDFAPDEGGVPAVGTAFSTVVSGRALLSGGAATSMMGALTKAMVDVNVIGSSVVIQSNKLLRFSSTLQETMIQMLATLPPLSDAVAGKEGSTGTTADGATSSDHSAALGDVAKALDQMDVLSGALDGLYDKLRAALSKQGRPGDGELVAGFLRIRRLRLVDGYGQFLDLVGSSATSVADSTRILKAGPLALAGRSDLVALPPRLTTRARLWVRFANADEGPNASSPLDDMQAQPLCGFVMPNHVDGSLDFYAVGGETLGKIRTDWVLDPAAPPRIVWEDAPGRPSTVGEPPSRAIPNHWLGSMADALLAWGRTHPSTAAEHALSALLRLIDSTRWTVDPFGHAGDEHLALLVGHPVVALRAHVKLEVVDEQGLPAAITTPFPLRLGALTHWQDGLFGYFINDDYTRFHCVDAAAAGFARRIGPQQGFLAGVGNGSVAFAEITADLDSSGGGDGDTPVQHPYIDVSEVVWIQPNQETWLTLLVEPHTEVHATMGLLPRKSAAMRREWIMPGITNLAPTFRFGPVLQDPKTVRMPIPVDLQGVWSWDHRADINQWENTPVTNATGDAPLSSAPSAVHEGWLQLMPPTASPNLSLHHSGDPPAGA
jgi:hypothetical protein